MTKLSSFTDEHDRGVIVRAALRWRGGDRQGARALISREFAGCTPALTLRAMQAVDEVATSQSIAPTAENGGRVGAVEARRAGESGAVVRVTEQMP